jgi:hypothetical protein
MVPDEEIKIAVESRNSDQEEVHTHPSFAQISANRVSSTGTYLYGSEFSHQHLIRLTIKHSERRRGLSRDWFFDRKEIVSVQMSEAQWAGLVSSLNHGSGIPCTLNSIAYQHVPGIKRNIDKREQFGAEMKARLTRVTDSLTQMRKEIEAMPLSGTKKKILLDQVATCERNLAPNLGFVADQFGEHMENITQDAKTEIEAFVNSRIHDAGLTAILNGDTPLRLK